MKTIKIENSKLNWENIINTFFYLLEIFLTLGSYLIYYYSQRRMGFMRYIVYLNRKIDTSFSILLFSKLIIFLLSATIIYQLYLIIGSKKNINKTLATKLLIMEIITLLTAQKFLFSGIQNSIFLIFFTLILVVETIRILIKKRSSIK